MNQKKNILKILRHHVSGAIERGEAEPILGVEIKEVLGGGFLVSVGGFQWGPPSSHPDSGAYPDTWPTKEEAFQAWKDAHKTHG